LITILQPIAITVVMLSALRQLTISTTVIFRQETASFTLVLAGKNKLINTNRNLGLRIRGDLVANANQLTSAK